VDLTFAPVFKRVLVANVKSRAAPELYFADVPLGSNIRKSASCEGMRMLERFQAKWRPVRVKKTRQIKNPEPRFDSIETEKALEPEHQP
jgi:hypothetical protein